jgi:hypothetical protein
MQGKKRVLIIAACCAAALGVSGCDTIRELIVGQVVEPRFTGPFLTAPDVTQIANSTPDRITNSATNIYFLWTHPEASNSAPYQCRIVTVNVTGAPAETEVGQVGGTSTPNTIGGQIQFAMEAGTLLPGTYRAEILLRGQQFGQVQFEVHAQ